MAGLGIRHQQVTRSSLVAGSTIPCYSLLLGPNLQHPLHHTGRAIPTDRNDMGVGA